MLPMRRLARVLYVILVLIFVAYIISEGLTRGVAPGWLAYWSSAATLLVLAPWYPLAGVASYLVMTYGVSSHSSELDVLISMRLSDAVAGYALVASLLTYGGLARLRAMVTVTNYPVLLLFAWIGICVTVALSRGMPWGAFPRHDPAGFFQAAAIVIAMAISLTSRRESLVLIAFVVLIILGRALAQGLQGIYLESYIATLLVMAIPLAGLGAWISRGWISRTFFILALLLMTVLLAYTHNRSAALGGLAIVATIAWQSIRHRQIKVLAAGAVLAVMVLFLTPPGYINRFKALLVSGSEHATVELDRSTAIERLELWQAGLKMAADHPWTGVGPGNYPVLLHVYLPNKEPLAAHNNYVQMLAETGFPGLVLYLLFFIYSLRVLQQICMNSSLPWIRHSALVLQSTLAAYLLIGMFASRHDFVFAYMLAGWALALALANPSIAGDNDATVPSRADKT